MNKLYSSCITVLKFASVFATVVTTVKVAMVSRSFYKGNTCSNEADLLFNQVKNKLSQRSCNLFEVVSTLRIDLNSPLEEIQ